MAVDRDTIIAQATEIANQLKEFNDTLDVAAPLVLPEVARCLDHMKPVAELIYGYLTSGKFQGAVKAQEILKMANTLIAAGKAPGVAYNEATEVVNRVFVDNKVF